MIELSLSHQGNKELLICPNNSRNKYRKYYITHK